MSDLYPQFPLYIPSKGRHEYMITSKALTLMGVRHYIVVEPSQVDDYEKAVKRFGLLTTVLPLDMSYKGKYELCDDLGETKGTGPGPARNFAWDHAIANGHKWHWVMDDNIRAFKRLHRNARVKVESASFWRAMEDFCLRYENVAMAGPNYTMFAITSKMSNFPPFVSNTRIYSCNLIRNDVPFRWRGRYNEDTIMSLDMLKAGWCTVLFNAFLQDKLQTQKIPGGNTSELYEGGTRTEGQKYATNGTTNKSQMMITTHPDVSRVVMKYGRVHHHVNYLPFKSLKMRLKPEFKVSSGNNEYGMELKVRKSA